METKKINVIGCVLGIFPVIFIIGYFYYLLNTENGLKKLNRVDPGRANRIKAQELRNNRTLYGLSPIEIRDNKKCIEKHIIFARSRCFSRYSDTIIQRCINRFLYDVCVRRKYQRN